MPPTETTLELGWKLNVQQLIRLLVLAFDLRVLLPPDVPPAAGCADKVLVTLASWCAPLHAPHPGQTDRRHVQEEYVGALMAVTSPKLEHCGPPRTGDHLAPAGPL